MYLLFGARVYYLMSVLIRTLFTRIYSQQVTTSYRRAILSTPCEKPQDHNG